MRQLPKAKTKDDVVFIFEQLEAIGDEKINGKQVNFIGICIIYISIYIITNVNC